MREGRGEEGRRDEEEGEGEGEDEEGINFHAAGMTIFLLTILDRWRIHKTAHRVRGS